MYLADKAPSWSPGTKAPVKPGRPRQDRDSRKNATKRLRNRDGDQKSTSTIQKADTLGNRNRLTKPTGVKRKQRDSLQGQEERKK